MKKVWLVVLLVLSAGQTAMAQLDLKTRPVGFVWGVRNVALEYMFAPTLSAEVSGMWYQNARFYDNGALYRITDGAGLLLLGRKYFSPKGATANGAFTGPVLLYRNLDFENAGILKTFRAGWHVGLKIIPPPRMIFELDLGTTVGLLEDREVPYGLGELGLNVNWFCRVSLGYRLAGPLDPSNYNGH